MNISQSMSKTRFLSKRFQYKIEHQWKNKAPHQCLTFNIYCLTISIYRDTVEKSQLAHSNRFIKSTIEGLRDRVDKNTLLRHIHSNRFEESNPQLKGQKKHSYFSKLYLVSPTLCLHNKDLLYPQYAQWHKGEESHNSRLAWGM